MKTINPEVERAIEEIRARFPGQTVDTEADGEGGAHVKVHDLPIGSQYRPDRSWVGFRITFQYPFADVYPHFLQNGIVRVDGAGLGETFNPGHTFERPSGKEPAILVSRRSNHRDPVTETAALKLAKVLDWIRAR
jgi:hypothetical protein